LPEDERQRRQQRTRRRRRLITIGYYRLGHAAGSARLSEISLRVSHVFRPVIVRSPSDDDTLFFVAVYILF